MFICPQLNTGEKWCPKLYQSMFLRFFQNAHDILKLPTYNLLILTFTYNKENKFYRNLYSHFLVKSAQRNTSTIATDIQACFSFSDEWHGKICSFTNLSNVQKKTPILFLSLLWYLTRLNPCKQLYQQFIFGKIIFFSIQ